MKGVFHHTYLASQPAGEDAGVELLGCPLDATSSFRGGTKFAPESIRRASYTLETFSPYLKRDLADVMFYDAGDLELRSGDLPFSLAHIELAVSETVGTGKRVLVLGGEHLATYAVVKGMKKLFSNLTVVQFDAHCDLIDEYEGQRLSHATVMKRVKELGGLELLQIGVRSGTKQEFEELQAIDSPASLAGRLIGDTPLYVTFDMDVFDPSLAAGVTTPEPGGLTFREVMEYFSVLSGMNIVGADIVELAPDYDVTFVSSITAAKVARELLMLLHH